MNRIFCDMDGPLCDFDGRMAEYGVTGDELKKWPGLYRTLKPTPGGVEAVRSLIGMGWDVFLATKPPTGVPDAYADKVRWVLDHLPELKRKLIITPDKGLLGDQLDYLIDDRPHKANCFQFPGKLIVYGEDNYVSSSLSLGWPEILEYFRGRAILYRV